MDTETISMFSTAQVGIIAAAIGAAGTLIAGAVKFGFSRMLKGVDKLGDRVDKATHQAEQTDRGFIELRAVIKEGRDDIREIRDEVRSGLAALADVMAEQHRPSDQSERQRKRTVPTGVVRFPKRTNGDT